MEKQDSEIEQITETTDITSPAWLGFVDVPRNFDKAHKAMENPAHITAQKQSASRGMFIVCLKDEKRSPLAISCARSGAVIATSDCATVNHAEIIPNISPGMPKALAKTSLLLGI